MLTAGVFLGGGFAAAAGAFMPGTLLFETDSFTDRCSGGVGSPPHVFFCAHVYRKVIEIVKALTSGCAVGFECLQGVLLRLRMRIAHGDRSEGVYGRSRV